MGGLWALDVSNTSDSQGGALKLEVQGKHKPWDLQKQGCALKLQMHKPWSITIPSYLLLII